MARFHSFSWLHNVPFNTCATSQLLIHWWILRLSPYFGYYKRYTWKHIYLLKLVFFFSLGKYPVVELLGEGNGNPLQYSCWRIPGMGEPGGLPSMGSHRLGHDWSDLAAAAAAVELLGDTVVSLFMFWGTSLLFFIVAAPIHIPTNSAQGPRFSTSSPALLISYFLGKSHPIR